jgi:hypothetical protein
VPAEDVALRAWIWASSPLFNRFQRGGLLGGIESAMGKRPFGK